MSALIAEMLRTIVLILEYGNMPSKNLTTMASLEMLHNDLVSLLYNVLP
jgi:hypothetical protein